LWEAAFSCAVMVCIYTNRLFQALKTTYVYECFRKCIIHWIMGYRPVMPRTASTKKKLEACVCGWDTTACAHIHARPPLPVLVVWSWSSVLLTARVTLGGLPSQFLFLLFFPCSSAGPGGGSHLALVICLC